MPETYTRKALSRISENLRHWQYKRVAAIWNHKPEVWQHHQYKTRYRQLVSHDIQRQPISTCRYLSLEAKFWRRIVSSSASSVSGFILLTGRFMRIFWTSGSKPMLIILSACHTAKHTGVTSGHVKLLLNLAALSQIKNSTYYLTALSIILQRTRVLWLWWENVHNKSSRFDKILDHDRQTLGEEI